MIQIPPPPPAIDQLPAGHRLVAGLTHSIVLPDFDFETRSEAGYLWLGPSPKYPLGRWAHAEGTSTPANAGLPTVGLDVYAHHPSTRVLSLAYNLKDGLGSRMWMPGLPPPADLLEYLQMQRGLIEAWNVGFELRIWNVVCTKLFGWPPLDPLQVRCAMAKARAFGLAGKLEVTGEVLKIEHQKDPRGDELLKLFSRPQQPTKKQPKPILELFDLPADGAALLEYNARDIVAEAECSALVPELSPLELRNWHNDQAINRRGMAVDLAAVHAAAQIVREAMKRYGEEMRQLTGGIEPSEVKQILGWLKARGVQVGDSLDAEVIDSLLTRLPEGSPERRAVEIRAATASASVKKLFAIINQTGPDGRLHDLYAFYGARTGRPTGFGPQPMNLPKAGPEVYRCGWISGKLQAPSPGCGRYFGAKRITCPWCGALRGPQAPLEWNPAAMEDAIEIVSSGSFDAVAHFFVDVLLTIGGCLRGMIVAGPGMELVSSDFTAIEGVVIACLAGEQWRIDAYRDDAPMYLVSAERMFGTPVAEMQAYAKEHGHHHPLRQKGKGGELGLGFGGWITALRNFGVDGADSELKDTVLKWRAASPALVEFWGGQTRDKFNRYSERPELFGLEGAAVKAIQNPGTRCEVRQLGGASTGISYLVHGDVLYCHTPGGGAIHYQRPRLRPATRDYASPWELQITFEGWNTNVKKGAAGWMEMQLYGGLQAENVTQKIARDIQMQAIDNCERNAHPIVMHTYDEDVAEVPKGTGNVERLEALMCDVPEFAQDWPIKAAGGWCGYRYRKA